MRCYACNSEIGMENWAPMVASGQCAWCGWRDERQELLRREALEKTFLENTESLVCEDAQDLNEHQEEETKYSVKKGRKHDKKI